MQRTLKDMIVIITGASSGIGKALADELSGRGAKLVLAARRLERLEALNTQLGGRHLCVRADVSQIDDCRMLIERAVSHFGRIDTLVCNAGYGLYRPAAQTTPEETRRIFQTNVFGTTDCIYFAAPLLEKQEPRDGFRGQIMIVSSVVARRGIPYISMYSATKAAQLALGEALRVELAPHRIAVTTVHPITTSTEFGQVAEATGRMRITDGPVVQSAQTVAVKMRRAIVRPRPEVWPKMGSRWALGLGTLVPGMVDLAAGKFRRAVDRTNSGSPTPTS